MLTDSIYHFQFSENRTAPSILAVFAHPDDEAFLIGGTLAHYARIEGARVELLCLTHGEKGFPENSGYFPAQMAAIRRKELEACCEVLGVHLLDMLDFPDGGLADLELNRLAWPVAEIIRQRQPEIVITFGPDGLTGHPDHLAVGQAVTRAFNASGVALPGSRLLYAGLHQPTVERLSNRMEGSLGEIPLRLTGSPEIGLAYQVDIRQTASYKWAALACHHSQQASFSSLTLADRQLLSQAEYFQLAAVAPPLYRFPVPGLLPQVERPLYRSL